MYLGGEGGWEMALPCCFVLADQFASNIFAWLLSLFLKKMFFILPENSYFVFVMHLFCRKMSLSFVHFIFFQRFSAAGSSNLVKLLIRISCMCFSSLYNDL